MIYSNGWPSASRESCIYQTLKNCSKRDKAGPGIKLYPPCKLTANAHGKSTILMVFTRKHGGLHGRLLLVSGRVI